MPVMADPAATCTLRRAHANAGHDSMSYRYDPASQCGRSKPSAVTPRVPIPLAFAEKVPCNSESRTFLRAQEVLRECGAFQKLEKLQVFGLQQDGCVPAMRTAKVTEKLQVFGLQQDGCVPAMRTAKVTAPFLDRRPWQRASSGARGADSSAKRSLHGVESCATASIWSAYGHPRPCLLGKRHVSLRLSALATATATAPATATATGSGPGRKWEFGGA
ncbi:hypothetical protein PYCCODRAFT_1429203 [Trametes coccinea BRFM310]|uniref:Uncharacterized protein n=1 Tax=Trametes coccinea (strain BRFM310) TaxID=1353009 RepID=A0A1Y2I543_TRAC3|nr:hypothetical protein PYCCODRAFT_1429203 [Trametes coccinea BRFM310]